MAAHLEPAHVVGRAAAAIASLALLAAIAQLNLTNVFVRLIPAAGRLTKSLVERGYAAVLVASLVLGVTYAGTGLGAIVVRPSLGDAVMFAAAVAVLAIFALEDSVLTGLRLARWVPAENVACACARLALLPVLAGTAAGSATTITLSWVIPAALAAVTVNWMLFRRVLPSLASSAGTLPRPRRLASFVAGEFTGSLFATATLQLIPLLVVWRRGATELAYFTLPWLISTAITLLFWNVAFSLAVELVGGHGAFTPLLKRTLALWGVIALGAMAVCVAGAHPLLMLVGSSYAEHGSGLLRLIGLSAPFTAVVTLWGTLAWLDQRVWTLAGFQAIIGGGLLLTTVILLPKLGLDAAGWANLVTQAVAAAVTAPLALRRIRAGREEMKS